MRIRIYLATFLTFAVAVIGSLFADDVKPNQPESLVSLREAWIAAKERDARPIKDQYLTALKNLRARFTKQEQLGNAVLVRDEIDVLTQGAERTIAEGEGPAELNSLRGIYEKEMSGMIAGNDRKYVEALKALQQRYSRSGDLESALAVGEELSTLEAMAKQAEGVLFNGENTKGWKSHDRSGRWIVEDGILKNVDGNIARLTCVSRMPGDKFIYEIRVRVMNGIRFRNHIGPDPTFYVGNEDVERRLALHGQDIVDVKLVGDDRYTTGIWYVLRVEADGAEVNLYKDGVLTHTATRNRVRPLEVAIVSGDAHSGGHIEVSSITLTRP